MADEKPISRAELRQPLREQLRRAWTRIRGGQLTPSRAAWSVGLGLLIGILPTPGLHVFLVLAVCLPLRLDAAVSYLAANISIPPVAPFLWFAAIQIGARLLQGHFVPLTVVGARALVHHPGPLLAAIAVGALALGTTVGTLGGLLTFGLVRFRRARATVPDAFASAIARTAERFARATRSRGTYYYVRGKLSGDPSTKAIASLGPLGDVLDLGCGRGQLDVLLLESAAATHVTGTDWDAAKIDLAKRSAEGLASAFETVDVRNVGERDADTVMLVDVLHYFDRETQDQLLVRAGQRVRRGGRLLVRDADAARGWRSLATRIPEIIGTAIRFNRGERVLFRDISREWVPLLEANGFTCTVEPCWGGTPFSNVLLVARRTG